MDDQAGSSRRAPPMTPPPSPTLPKDDSGDAILWATSEGSSSSTAHTDLLSLWLSNYTALPHFDAEEEPVADVPTLLNFNLESPFLDLVDWKTTSTAVTQAPVDTQPLWVLLNAPAAGEVDDLALGLQSPEASILPLALRIQDPEAFISPLALGTHPPPASSEIAAPQASLSPPELGLQPLPAASFGIQPFQAPISPLTLETEPSIVPLARGMQFPEASISPPISPLALGIEAPQISFGILSVPSSFSSLPPIPWTFPMAPPLWSLPSIPCTLPMAPPLWSLPSIPCTLPMAPPLWNLPSIPCTLPMAPPPLWNLPPIPCTWPMAPPLWTLPSIPCTLPMAPPLWNFLPSSSPVPERRSWSVFPSPPPPAQRQQLLLPYSASASVSSPSSHPSHQPHHFFPAPDTGCQQQVPVAHAPVTFSTLNANANFNAGFDPTSRLPSLAMAPRRSWTSDQPWIRSGKDKKLPIPRRRPRFSLPPAAPAPAPAATMPAASTPLLANFRSSVGNMPSCNARGDVPVGDQQRVQTGESSRPRKRSKRALDPSGSEASHWNHNGAQVAPIARVPFVPELALNRDGKARAPPGTATNIQSSFARYQREKIKERIKILQSLVPNGNKADMSILLKQAHLYIRFLEHQIKLLASSVDWKLETPFVYMDPSQPQ